MGRKRISPVSINDFVSTTEVPASDGLPAFKRHIDIHSEKNGRKAITRLFFVTPSQQEIDDATKLYQHKDIDVHVQSALMSYMVGKQRISEPLLQYCLKLKTSNDFATDLVRLAINFLEGKHYSFAVVSDKTRSLKEFAHFLATRTNNPSELTLTSFNKEVWLDYLSHKEADHRTSAKKSFIHVKRFFNAYSPIAHGGWLNQISFRERHNRKPSQEHTSELADTKDYSDIIMYQLLALMIEGFQRRIGYLKHYKSLTASDMPKDWIYPGRKNSFLPSIKRGNKTTWAAETTKLLSNWLNDEEEGYQILIDHYIMHHKAGLANILASDDIPRKFHQQIRHWCKESGPTRQNPLVSKFFETMRRWHGYGNGKHNLSLLHFYVKKKTANEKNGVINQIAWCLANLLMIQTGINKEVALTIPSKAENGESILTRGDSLFVTSEGNTEIELYGIKTRVGNGPRKVIPIPIPKDSPLYEMLIDYAHFVKVDFDGPFFELDKGFSNVWSTAGGLRDLAQLYPVLDENSEQLPSIDSTRFRKVFASGQLMNRMQGIKDGNELAEKLRDDLNHGNLDVTLTNYIMKSSVGRSVIDTAIATITSEKLEEGLRFRGKIALTGTNNIKKKVFLCDCEDPTNPSHAVAIAEECKHYDLCLGCERSVITRIHLPYICVRIIQYEEARALDPHIWPALFEDRWNIAHNALDKYVATDKKHGQRLVDEAWTTAREGRVSLPPIIASNRI
jgi:hypothetical protein